MEAVARFSENEASKGEQMERLSEQEIIDIRKQCKPWVGDDDLITKWYVECGEVYAGKTIEAIEYQRIHAAETAKPLFDRLLAAVNQHIADNLHVGDISDDEIQDLTLKLAKGRGPND